MLIDDQEGDPQLIEKAKKVLDPEVSPLLVDDQKLAKLMPTYILSVGHDRLRDCAFIYEGRLKRVQVPVVHDHYEHTFHGSIGFLHGPFALDIAHEMINEVSSKKLFSLVEQKKHYRKYVDWSLIPSKYRTVYKNPITDDQEGDPQLIEKAKKVLDPEVSPLLVDDQKLAKLMPTYILSVGHDRLRDCAFIYEGRLKRVHVPVVHDHYEHTFHGSIGFLHGPFALDIAHEMISGVVKYIKENL
ncbi:unnamed protein product [Adineta steineri]|uniref:Alpha/beta hydrolase fold-3 domain-containing protein n=1 Tax=Adineta steineri TaxID=433720 RepID=A0A813NLD4_9BILA|nr:unnamed protein product [Adineta steineri]